MQGEITDVQGESSRYVGIGDYVTDRVQNCIPSLVGPEHAAGRVLEGSEQIDPAQPELGACHVICHN